MLRCTRCGNLSALEPSGLCPRCLALEPAAGERPEPTQATVVHYPATWSLILVTVVTSILGYAFRYSGLPLGAAIGWRTVGGNQWWRLLTGFFVHRGFDHAFSNLFILWIVGKRLERIEGARDFLGLYMACGLAGSVSSLAFNPERTCFGASGAVFGVCAAVIAIYCIRFRTLTNSQKWRLGFLIFFTAGSVVAGFFDEETDNPGHIGGIIAGLFLGLLFMSRFAQTSRQRMRIFAGVGMILVSACIWIRVSRPYLVHVNAAERALDRSRYDDAARELHIALEMKPTSPLAHRLVDQLQAERSPLDRCASLLPNSSETGGLMGPCAAMQCDGRPHAFTARDGVKFYYVGTITTEIPLVNSGRMEREITANITAQVLDDFGEIGCTTSWLRVSRQMVDGGGTLIDSPVVSSETNRTLSPFDPQAQALHKMIFAGEF